MPLVVPIIAFVRVTDKITDAMVDAYIAAQQIQIDADWFPAWGSGALCEAVPFGLADKSGRWLCLLEDHSPDPGALGFHDVTPEGLPVMHVYVGDDLRDGLAWTVTASHEVLETLGDPDISRTVPVTRDGVSVEYAREVCDTCEDDEFAYNINGVQVSDFALPSWFDPDGQEPFTFRRTVHAPFELAEGGYIGVREIYPTAGEWTQRLAQGARGKRSIKGATSRTMRRFGKP